MLVPPHPPHDRVLGKDFARGQDGLAAKLALPPPNPHHQSAQSQECGAAKLMWQQHDGSRSRLILSMPAQLVAWSLFSEGLTGPVCTAIRDGKALSLHCGWLAKCATVNLTEALQTNWADSACA